MKMNFNDRCATSFGPGRTASNSFVDQRYRFRNFRPTPLRLTADPFPYRTVQLKRVTMAELFRQNLVYGGSRQSLSARCSLGGHSATCGIKFSKANLFDLKFRFLCQGLRKSFLDRGPLTGALYLRLFMLFFSGVLQVGSSFCEIRFLSRTISVF